MIRHNFYSVCYKETEDSPIDLDPENDPLDSKGCPQFCPKEPTVDCETVCPNGYSDYFMVLTHRTHVIKLNVNLHLH